MHIYYIIEKVQRFLGYLMISAERVHGLDIGDVI